MKDHVLRMESHNHLMTPRIAETSQKAIGTDDLKPQ